MTTNRERCSAYHEGKQCRAWKNLTRCVIRTDAGPGTLQLPAKVIVLLCDFHFNLKASN